MSIVKNFHAENFGPGGPDRQSAEKRLYLPTFTEVPGGRQAIWAEIPAGRPNFRWVFHRNGGSRAPFQELLLSKDAPSAV